MISSIGYFKASNTDANDNVQSISLSADGNTLAVGSSSEDSNATGINGDQLDNSTNNTGAVDVFSRTNTTWQQQAYIKASHTDSFDFFGGNQSDNSADATSAVYLY